MPGVTANAHVSYATPARPPPNDQSSAVVVVMTIMTSSGSMPGATLSRSTIHQASIECLLRSRRAGFACGDRDQDEVIRARPTQIVRVDRQLIGFMLMYQRRPHRPTAWESCPYAGSGRHSLTPGRIHQNPLPLVTLEAPCIVRSFATAALDRAGVAWRVASTSPRLSGLWAATTAGLELTICTRFGLSAGVRALPPGHLDCPRYPRSGCCYFAPTRRRQRAMAHHARTSATCTECIDACIRAASRFACDRLCRTGATKAPGPWYPFASPPRL